MSELSVYDNDPTLYLFTSLTAGSSHIVTATSRIETILKANKIPFKGVDTATDELARKLYGRRARGKKLPLLVKEGFVIADLEQIEEWNEYDELKEALGVSSTPAPVPAKSTPAPVAAAPAATAAQKENTPISSSEQNLALRQLGAEAAKVAASKKHVPEKITTTNPLLAEKLNSPAASTPTKGSKADTSAILSPRSIPLPATPHAAPSSSAAEDQPPTAKSPTIPKLTSKPVHSPPSRHIDDANPALGAAPISSSSSANNVRSPRSSIASPVPQSPGSNPTSPITEFHGSRVGMVSDEEIKQIEQEQAIPEVSSTEEEDSEYEPLARKGAGKNNAGKAEVAGALESEEDSDEEDSSEEEKTQQQSAKAAAKAGDSVLD